MVTRQRVAREGRGFHGIGIWSPKTWENVGSLWRSAYSFGSAFIYTVGSRYQRQSSDTPDTARHVPLLRFADLDDLIGHLPHGCQLIAAELTSEAVSLESYAHPERACYLLGSEDHGLPPAVMARAHVVVRVPSARPPSLNVAVAGSLVLYDRWVKRCQVSPVRDDRGSAV